MGRPRGRPPQGHTSPEGEKATLVDYLRHYRTDEDPALDFNGAVEGRMQDGTIPLRDCWCT